MNHIIATFKAQTYCSRSNQLLNCKYPYELQLLHSDKHRYCYISKYMYIHVKGV